MNNQEIYKKLISKYGDRQVIKAVEELSELAKELCKGLNGHGDIHNIIEEIADVIIMLEQMKIYFDISQAEIEEIKKKKIERTRERLLNA